MRRNKDPLFWAAMQVHRHLSRSGNRENDDDAGQWANYLAERQQSLASIWHRIVTAHARGWHGAARRLRDLLFYEARRVEAGAAELLKFQVDPATSAVAAGVPSPASILAELRQLAGEFEHVDVLPRERVVVARTGPITLESVPLGPFAIELHVDRLSRRPPDGACFDCVALDANPAAGDDSVTHPHVKGKTLCAGDATGPIAAALRAGRLADAFLLVRGVLQHYNPASPYVSLRDWSGSPCGECGRSVGPDDSFYCESCGHDVCDDCFTCCDVCGRSRCPGCLETDDVSDRRCCSACHHTCRTCRRVVDADRFDADSGLCPECLAEAPAESPTPEEDPADGDVPQPEPAERPAPPAGGEPPCVEVVPVQVRAA
jgi:hypothetical protein